MSKQFRVERRVAGYHDMRLDGMVELAMRARGASVLDVGCNRGLVSFEMANNGATLVHGCDYYEVGIQTATELFADLRSVESRFEVVDLKEGSNALRPFGTMRYDIVLMLATYHKLKRSVEPAILSGLMRDLGNRTLRYFGWRATSLQHRDNWKEMKILDDELAGCGLERIHTSWISEELGLCAIWHRK